MKIFAGNWLTVFWLLLGSFAAISTADARIDASVDRSDIAMGETLRLTVTANEDELPDNIDLTQLETSFDILQRSSATSARIIGGERNVTRTLELDLAPKRDGLLTIPALTYGGRQTTPIRIKVSPQSTVNVGDEVVYFDASANNEEVYVQAELIFSITLQQAINLDNRAISELDISNAYVETLEQKSYQRRTGGRLWQVTELRYAIFPQQSGPLTIPAITFSGRELLPGRSLLGARLGRRIALESKPITINVKPVPASFPGSVWLPARQLNLASRWSNAPDQLTVGDSSTRTFEMSAEGLQGSQLPPITTLMASRALPGLKFYPDQETIEQRELPTGIEGYRLQSEALVATNPGNWTLPELVIPWWNTESDTLEIARIPPVAINILPTLSATVESTPAGVADDSVLDAALSNNPVWLWQLLSALGWTLAAFMGWRLFHAQRRRQNTSPSLTNSGNISSRDLVALRLACSGNNPWQARQALLVWGQGWLDVDTAPTLSVLAQHVDSALSDEIRWLDTLLWSDTQESWQGDKLFGLVKDQCEKVKQSDSEALTLYPST